MGWQIEASTDIMNMQKYATSPLKHLVRRIQGNCQAACSEELLSAVPSVNEEEKGLAA